MKKSLQIYRSFFAAYCKKMTVALSLALLMFTACADAAPCAGTVSGTCPTGKLCALTPGSTTAYSCQTACIGSLSGGICPTGKACYLKPAEGYGMASYNCFTCTGTVSTGTCPTNQRCALTPGSTTAYSCQTACGPHSPGVCPTGQACYGRGNAYGCFTCTGTVSTGTCPTGQGCKVVGTTNTYACA